MSSLRHRTQVDVDKDHDEQKKNNSYSWESSKIRSWDQIEEDPETGLLKSFGQEEHIARKKIRDDSLSGVRRGIIRFCVIIIDMSNALRFTDLKPSRADILIRSVLMFAIQFFDQNPISQLSVVLTRDGGAQKMSEFSSNPKHIAAAVQKITRLGPLGVPSLQNALNLATGILSKVPPYGMREVIVCFGSLTTCDPGDIHSTIQDLVSAKIRCSAIGMAAELHILNVLTKKTEGSYAIAMHEEHYNESLNAHIVPPPTVPKRTSASLIRMGFPLQRRQKDAAQFANSVALKGRFGFECPRCTAWLSEIPCQCVLCGLTLVSSPHLARSYHHLFPADKYVSLEHSDAEMEPVDSANDPATAERTRWLIDAKALRCAGCKILLLKSEASRSSCPRCLRAFCIDCDMFVHDSLHNCPGCGKQDSDRK